MYSYTEQSNLYIKGSSFFALLKFSEKLCIMVNGRTRITKKVYYMGNIICTTEIFNAYI